jgi:hypothetical protein
MSYVRYLCLFVGELMSYLRYLCLFVGELMSYLHYLCLFVGVLMSYLRSLCLFVGEFMSYLRYWCIVCQRCKRFSAVTPVWVLQPTIAIIHRFSRLVTLLFHKWLFVRLNHKDACILTLT